MEFIILMAIFATTLYVSCSGEGKSVSKEDPKPWNISILLDLSDRITKKTSGMSQVEKDTAIVSCLIEELKNKIVKNRIVKSMDRIKVYFYPSPSDQSIYSKSKLLDVDFSQKDKASKKQTLKTLDETFKQSIASIYNASLNDNHWIGCDIWGFFDSQKAQTYCVKEGYRNILVILSDGFIYHGNNIIKQDNNYSYISSHTLSNLNSGLIPCKSIVGDLEVLFLEINALPTQSNRIKDILKDWFTGMNVAKCEIHDTDLPTNIKEVIGSFFKEE